MPGRIDICVNRLAFRNPDCDARIGECEPYMDVGRGIKFQADDRVGE